MLIVSMCHSLAIVIHKSFDLNFFPFLQVVCVSYPWKLKLEFLQFVFQLYRSSEIDGSEFFFLMLPFTSLTKSDHILRDSSLSRNTDTGIDCYAFNSIRTTLSVGFVLYWEFSVALKWACDLVYTSISWMFLCKLIKTRFDRIAFFSKVQTGGLIFSVMMRSTLKRSIYLIMKWPTW